MEPVFTLRRFADQCSQLEIDKARLPGRAGAGQAGRVDPYRRGFRLPARGTKGFRLRDFIRDSVAQQLFSFVPEFLALT